MNKIYTLKDISKVKAIIQCYINDAVFIGSSKSTYENTQVLPCRIDFGSVCKEDKLIFINKKGEIIDALDKNYTFKRYEKYYTEITHKSTCQLDNQFGIHISVDCMSDKNKENDKIFDMYLDELEKNLDYIIVLKEGE